MFVFFHVQFMILNMFVQELSWVDQGHFLARDSVRAPGECQTRQCVKSCSFLVMHRKLKNKTFVAETNFKQGCPY